MITAVSIIFVLAFVALGARPYRVRETLPLLDDEVAPMPATVYAGGGLLPSENVQKTEADPLRQIAKDAGILPEYLQLAMLDTQKHFQVSDSGKIVVLDEDGDPTDITPAKFFETLYREQRPKFYAASGASGSGAPSRTREFIGR